MDADRHTRAKPRAERRAPAFRAAVQTWRRGRLEALRKSWTRLDRFYISLLVRRTKVLPEHISPVDPISLGRPDRTF